MFCGKSSGARLPPLAQQVLDTDVVNPPVLASQRLHTSHHLGREERTALTVIVHFACDREIIVKSTLFSGAPGICKRWKNDLN